MPFLRPDVVKLDLHLVQQRPNHAVAEIMTAVTAYAEQSGADIFAEGIETELHEQMARSWQRETSALSSNDLGTGEPVTARAAV